MVDTFRFLIFKNNFNFSTLLKQFLISFIFFFFSIAASQACAVVYYIDSATGKIYVANNEDYWYDVDAYIQIEPKSKNKLARLWYGWNNFAQGGINEAGLFFDGAVTPLQQKIKGAKKYKGNLGNELLAKCKTVEEALEFLKNNKIGLPDAHMMLGDASGNAVVLEWIDGIEKIISIENNQLIMTNFLLADPSIGNHPCPRYNAIQSAIEKMETNESPIDFLSVGRTIGPAVQVPQKDKEGKTGGTLYSSFINISDMEFILIYKIDNKKITKLNLNEEFLNTKPKKIALE